MAYMNDGSGGYVNPSTADGEATNSILSNMFSVSPLFIRSDLVAGEAGGIPGFETTYNSVSKVPPITSASSWWDEIKSDMSSAVSSVYGGAKDITKTVYGDISSGIGTVYDDVSAPVKDAATSYYWYMILGVVVVGVLVVAVAKSGAVKVNAIV